MSKDQIKAKVAEVTGSRKTLRVAIGVLIALMVATFVVSFVQSAQNRSKIDDVAAQARARGQALGTANAVLTQNGIAPVTPTAAKPESGNTDVGPTTPSSTPKAQQGRQGETGATGATGPGPTTAQVQNAVADYCDAHKCGTGPTQAQVAAAVLTYCTSKDDCTGPAGASGEPGDDATGKPGASGSPGAPGPAPTADQISAAVAAYCSDGACTGPAGPAGKDGADGSNGTDGKNGVDGKDGTDAPHFTKISCQDDNSWLFTLSDGTTLTAAGPCRATETTVTVTAPPTSPDPASTAP